MRAAPFALVLLPALAFAEDADTLFREGRAAADEGNYAVACPKFEESYKLDPAPGTLLNLADCEENRGQLVKAWQHFRQLQDRLPASDVRKAVAASRAHALEQRWPQEPRAATPQPRDDRATPVTPPPTRVPDARRRTTVIVLTSVGLGVAALGTIVAVAGAAQMSGAACYGNTCANPAATGQFQSGQAFTIAGDVMIGAGVALVGSAVLVLLTSTRNAPTTTAIRF